MSTCAPSCWEPVRCPTHGREMTPLGRSAPMEMISCCDAHADPKVNTRHLWNEHDSTRHYTDPEGWAEHEKNCPECNPSIDEND